MFRLSTNSFFLSVSSFELVDTVDSDADVDTISYSYCPMYLLSCVAKAHELTLVPNYSSKYIYVKAFIDAYIR